MELAKKYKDLSSFSFGDGAELCDKLLALVLSGKKTATCGALRDYEEEIPKVGQMDIVLNSKKNPACVIKTTKVTICKFSDVPKEFALAEGEGDFDDWRNGHIAFFNRNGGFSPEMELVCECFELVEVLA